MNMVLDLRVGNSLAIQHEDRFIEVRVKGLTATGCEVIDLEDETHKVSFDDIYPIKITKRWLKDNDLTCMDENNIEEEGMELNYVHSSLPITYSHTDHRLFIYGHLFPVNVKYVHHFQNALLDCGIEFTPIFRDSHYTQVEGIPIINFLGGLKRCKDFFDTNVAFGLSKMPKFQMSQPRSASKVGTGIDPQSSFKLAFRSISGILDQKLRRIVRYVFDNINLTFTNRTAIIYVSYGERENIYYITSEPVSDIYAYTRATVACSWEKLVEFISTFNQFVRGDYDLGVVLAGGIKLQLTYNGLVNELVKRSVLLADILTSYESTGSRLQNRYYVLRKGVELQFKNSLTGKEFSGLSEMSLSIINQKYNNYVSIVVVTEEEWNNTSIIGSSSSRSPLRYPLESEGIYKVNFDPVAVAIPGSSHDEEVRAFEEEDQQAVNISGSSLEGVGISALEENGRAVYSAPINEEAIGEDLSPRPEIANRIIRKKPKVKGKRVK